ncbi:MAG: phage baseplate protein [Vicinamibacterales bacterium]
MRRLTGEDIVRVWEVGQDRDPLERAIVVLAAARLDGGADDLWRLSLGRRNTRLLDVHRLLFGDELSAFAECPSCVMPLEFTVPVDALAGRADLPAAADAAFDLTTGGYAVRFRLLDTADLRAAAAARDVDAARRVLVDRCILAARHGGDVVAASELPAPVVTELASRLAECDGGAETLIDLTCPSCGWTSQAPLDVASFVYDELCVHARRLLRDVDALARAYGWREADILAMSARRRQHYLELVG